MLYAKRILLSVLLLFGFLSSSVYAEHVQHPDFLHVGVEDGLSNGSVTSIVQDSLGFIWIGTKCGLNRYDGTHFKLYAIEHNMPCNDISVLYIDGKNRFWIGTVGNGLFIYNPVNDSFEQIILDEDNTGNFVCTEVHALLEGKDNLFWIATEAGLYSYNTLSKKAKLYRQKNKKSNEPETNDIRAMAEMPNGNLLLGTFGAGLSVFDTNTLAFKDFNLTNLSKLTTDFEYINAIFADNNGHILIGTNGNGLKLIDIQKKKALNYTSGTTDNEHIIIRCIWQDKRGNLWVGTDGAGILHIEKPWNLSPVIKNYRSNPVTSNSLSNNTVNTFFMDRQSNLWIATAKKGINLIKKTPHGIDCFYSDAQGYNKLPVLSVFSDKKGVWLGTDGDGLSLLDTKNQKRYFFNKTSNSGYVGDFVQCIKPASNDSYWLGTFDQGLYHINFRTKKITNFRRNPDMECSLPHNDVRDILLLPSGNLWIATWGGGLAFLDTKAKTVKVYKHEQDNPNSLGSNNVLSICSDGHGRLWLATYGGGLALFDPRTEKFKNFTTENSSGLISNFIYSLLLEDKYTLLAGTKEGLCRLNLQSFQFETIPAKSNEPDKTILSLLKDNNDNIWTGTKKGILHLQKGSKKIEFLPGVFNSFSPNSAYKDETGKLYFGGEEGVVAFQPSQIHFNADKIPVYLTDFLLFNQSVPVGTKSVLKHQICYEKKVTLKHGQSVITIEYAALDFPFSRNINYEIMMEGLEKEWRNAGNQHTVTYTNLSAGKYTFKVRPVSDIFTPGEIIPAQIDITVLPPFWLTWWAYLLYVLLFALLFYLILKYTSNWNRIRNELKLETVKREQEERMHQLKQRFFINISHDIRTPLTLISGSVNKLFNRNNTELQEQKILTMIKANTNRLLNLTEELLNYRKLETGNVVLKVSYENIVEFVREIYICYSQLSINKQIEYTFIHSHPDIYAWIDKVQLEKAIGNLISNAFKFTPEKGKITVEISLDPKGQISIHITDTGKGIASDKIDCIFNRFYQAEENAQRNGFGIGLSIAREVVLLHGGNINVNSEVGQGSDFLITLQSGKDHYENVEFLDTPLKDSLISEHIIRDEQRDILNPVFEQEVKEHSILVVDDNMHIKTYMSELLSPVYQVYDASNGQEALDIAVELMPDLIVSDVMMPVMDGITFCHKLKNDMRISHIPVILLTARTLVDAIIEGFETGADEYITKPFNERILLARINNILLSRQEIRKRVQHEMILNPKEVSLNNQDGIFLSKLVGYVEEHIKDTDFNIVQMAEEMAMSHSSLYKKVKALMGMTVTGFVKDFRLKRAAQLLIQNELHITEIAYMVGYSERRHFSHDFKQKFNCTPKEYIEKTKE